MEVKLGSRSLPATELFGLLTAVLVIIGSMTTWVCTWGEGFVENDIELVCVNGTNGDGRVTLALGILAAVLVLWRLLRPRSTTLSTIVLCTTIVVLAIAGLFGVLNWSELSNFPGVYHGARHFAIGYQPGWGLIVMTVSGLTGACALAYQVWRDHFR